ncbi:hypothetical protein YC2023_069341 [Brassica napus]
MVSESRYAGRDSAVIAVEGPASLLAGKSYSYVLQLWMSCLFHYCFSGRR